MAILMGLHSFATQLPGKHVQIVSDNITFVSYVACQGGSVEELSQLATAIWSLATEHKIYLSAKHLAGKLNQKADFLSRYHN